MLSTDLLKTFIVFVESDNITQAAQKLHLSQPAVTQQLKNFEQSIGRPLFSMRGKKKVLNLVGRKLYEQMRPQYKTLEQQFEQSCRWLKDLTQIELKIGGRREVLAELAPRLQFPGQISLLTMSSQMALKQLQTHQIDIALTHDLPSISGLYQQQFKADSNHFLIHKNRLGQAKAQLKIFRQHNFIKSTPCLSYRRPSPHLDEWCQHIQLDPKHLNIRVTFDDWPTIVKLVEADFGWTLCPSSFTSEHPNVIQLPVSSKIVSSTPIFIVYHEDLKKTVHVSNLFGLKK